MKIRNVIACGTGPLVAGLMAISIPATAVAQTATPSPAQLLKLIQQQQKQLDEMKAALLRAQKSAETASAKADEAKAAAPKGSLPDYLNIGGTIEVEGTESEAFNQSDTSDITLAKVELFFDANPNDWLAGHVQVLYEDDGTETISLDEAWATVGNKEKFPAWLQAGKWAVPFGDFDTDMSTDPLTKNLGETKEATVLVGVTSAGFTAQAFVYNGDTQKSAGGNHIDQFGLVAGYEREFGGGRFNVGAGYISNVADSDGLTTALGGNSGSLANYVPGHTVHGSYSIGGFTVRGGYLTASKAFQSGEVAFNGAGAEPTAWNAEFSYTTPFRDRDVTFALTAQGTEEALALGLPERRLGAAVTLGVVDNASVTFEYLRDEDYGTGDGGTGNDGHTGTVKLAVEF
jgi:hypothetical protein